MNTDNSRHSFLYGLILLLMAWAIPAMAQADPQDAVDLFVKTAGVPRSSMAVLITDLSDGSVTGEHNPTLPLVPASIMKSVTTAALLRQAGKDFRFNTPVYVDGPVDMGILRGNIIVAGSGDPSLHSHAAPGSPDLTQEITEVLRLMGIHAVQGHVIVDNSLWAGQPRPESWAKADFSQSYGAAAYPFNFESNASGRHSVERPDLIFASRLKSHLRNNGIDVLGENIGEGNRSQILDHVSAPLDEIMRSCMMRSDNLYAECMLRTFGLRAGGDGSTPDAARRETELWLGDSLPLDGVRIIDGSGLSRDNRVTAGFMTALLTAMHSDPDYASFFPLAGQDGTLRKFLADTPLDGYIAMKTGSMNGIQCYAGYMLDDDYAPTHTVVIILNDIGKNRDRAKRAAQTMLLDIFAPNS